MSFRCFKCDQPQPSGTRPREVVTDLRIRDYQGKPGWEIVKIVKVCQTCNVEAAVPPPRIVDKDFKLPNSVGDAARRAA